MVDPRLMARTRGLPRLIWRTTERFFSDDCPGMAAALAFTTVFSLPALLALLLALVGLVSDPEKVQSAITTQVSSLIGAAAAEQVRIIIVSARKVGGTLTIAAVFGGLMLLFGATAAFAQLQGALNRVWNVKPDPRRGRIGDFLMKRVFSFGVVLVVAFLLVVSLAMSALLGAASQRLTRGLGIPAAVLQAGDFLISFTVVTLLFAAMFKLLPDAEIEWREVWAGGVGTAIFFVLGKFLIGLYLGRGDPGSAFGAAGSLAVVLIWIYYSAMILLFGAEFTRIWSEKDGKQVEPRKGAVEVVEEEKVVKVG